MTEKSIVCTSCKTKIIGSTASVFFKCPKCEKEEIIRCERCRRLGVKYTCLSCGFTGPN